MIDLNFIQYFEVNLIRLIIGVLFILIGLSGKETSLNEQPNTSTFVFLTGILLMGLSIS